jgi:hypothetical protein
MDTVTNEELPPLRNRNESTRQQCRRINRESSAHRLATYLDVYASRISSVRRRTHELTEMDSRINDCLQHRVVRRIGVPDDARTTGESSRHHSAGTRRGERSSDVRHSVCGTNDLDVA